MLKLKIEKVGSSRYVLITDYSGRIRLPAEQAAALLGKTKRICRAVTRKSPCDFILGDLWGDVNSAGCLVLTNNFGRIWLSPGDALMLLCWLQKKADRFACS